MPTFQSMRQRLPSSYDTDGWRDLWPDDPNVFPSDEPASQLAVAPPSGPMGTGLANANVLAAALAQRGPDAAYQTDIVPANAVGSNGGFAPWAAGSGEPQTPFINTSWAG